MRNVGSTEKEDLKKAVQLFSLSAEQGNDFARCALAYCYEEGRDVEIDLKRAFNEYAILACKGFAIGQFHLACCYETGIGVEANIQRAIYWFTQAAKQGDDASIRVLSELCKTDCSLEYYLT
jgi:uncharacterized protein